ncbi:phenylalanine--tRNA ligase beta subunit [Alphaproteobacteria bacterium]|nr:phenylalanine--tRNA ligase beta subunit [Alphaproteobacteria bacterium]
MKFTIGWLKEYLDTDAGLGAICDRLTAIGLEVESVRDPSAELRGLVVGEVVECAPHPNSDHLNLLKVSDGRGVYQVVCGAPNCRKGLKSVLALPGTIIPETGKPLEKGVIRGLESQGMMCSARELKLGSDHTGIIELPADSVTGAEFRGLGASEPVIEVNVTPNRPDALGVYGIARDLAASGLGKLRPVVPAPSFKPSFPNPIRQGTESKCCPVLMTRAIKGIDNTRKSPKWLCDRLEAVGARAISPAVDITNYMMLAYNRPMHAFDARNIAGGLFVREAPEAFEFLTLDGKKRAIQPGMAMFYDEAGPLSVAGLMGGKSTAVAPDTTTVILESAWFEPAAIAGTGRRLGINSDARYRFERGVDPLACEEMLDVATQLLIDIAGGQASEKTVADSYPRAAAPIPFSAERFARHIGVPLPLAQCEKYLAAVGCRKQAGGWLAPSWRPDISGQHDLFEEVIRLHGYDHLPATALPSAQAFKPILTKGQKIRASVQRNLAAHGLMQAITFSFMDAKIAAQFGGKAVALLNPISSELAEMRPSLLPNLLIAARNNAARGYPDSALFEVGPVFSSYAPGAQVEMAATVRGGGTRRHPLESGRAVDAFDAKADAMVALAAADVAGLASTTTSAEGLPAWYHPARSGAIVQGKAVLAYFGELHPQLARDLDIKHPVAMAEIYIGAGGSAKHAPKTLKMSGLQPIAKDLAFVVDAGVAAEKLAAMVRNLDHKLIADAYVFDVYAGAGVEAGKKSVGLALAIQPEDKPLTDQEIEGLFRRIEAAAAKSFNAVLRT